jgi:putative hydrolase of the HAD superfamily
VTQPAGSIDESTMTNPIDPLATTLPPPGVRTILFDFDGTLVFHQPDSFDVISAFCAEIGQPLEAEAERLGRRMRHEYFVDPMIREEIDGLSGDEFWEHFNHFLLEGLGIEGDMPQLVRELGARFDQVELSYHCPIAGCRTLDGLRERGYGLGLITNRENVARFYDLLQKMQLSSFFAVTLASGEVGVSKPNPGIFYAAMERLGATAEESLYVGDNYWADVVGAKRAGITPVLFDPHRLFPEADCTVVEHIDDLLSWLP